MTEYVNFDWPAFVHDLKQYRENQGIGRELASKQSGVNGPHMLRIERGESINCNTKVLVRLLVWADLDINDYVRVA